MFQFRSSYHHRAIFQPLGPWGNLSALGSLGLWVNVSVQVKLATQGNSSAIRSLGSLHERCAIYVIGGGALLGNVSAPGVDNASAPGVLLGNVSAPDLFMANVFVSAPPGQCFSPLGCLLV